MNSAQSAIALFMLETIRPASARFARKKPFVAASQRFFSPPARDSRLDQPDQKTVLDKALKGIVREHTEKDRLFTAGPFGVVVAPWREGDGGFHTGLFFGLDL